MKYIVQSTAVWDTITVPQNEGVVNAPGGAGFYALAGMKVWDDDVLIVTGTGADYLRNFGNWYHRNAIKTDGLLTKDDKTPRTFVQYDALGERVEKASFGAEHYSKIEATPEEIEPFCKDCLGMYIFKNTDPCYWSGILPIKVKYGFQISWEIAADAAVFECLPAVRRIAEQVEMFSINMTEAQNLLSVNKLDDMIRGFLKWNVSLIYLRMGSRGVCVIKDGEVTLVPSVQSLDVVDTTGGGNSSTGGAFIGFCRGYDPEVIGAMGNVSASFCIEQWGTPDVMDVQLRMKAHKRLQDIIASRNKVE